MNPRYYSYGLVMVCTLDGVVKEILNNDLGFTDLELLGKPFPALVSSTSFQKALSFLTELKAKGTIFDWELDLPIRGNLELAHFAGLVLKDKLLILTAQSRSEMQDLYEELMRINSAQTNLIRSLTKEQVSKSRDQFEHDVGYLDELTKLNNELVNLQRELAKKNAELERLYAEVSRIAIVDELTQIYNRRGFFEFGNREVARAKRFGSPLSAILFDIDHFKKFNDSYGHAVGDQVLVEVAKTSNKQLRKVDIFGRYGGEEFTVLLPETQKNNAAITAERLRRSISQMKVQTNQGSLSVTISLGVAEMKTRTTGLEILLQEADEALYRAKEGGRNCVMVA